MRTKRADIEALDRALDRLVAGDSVRAGGSPVDPLAGVAARLRTMYAAEAPAEVAARHLAAIRDDAAPVVPAVRLRRRRARALAVGLAAAAMLLMMASSAVAMSARALPGETLYPVKRAVERMRLALPGDLGTKAKLHLDFADRRLDELQLLLAARDGGADVDVDAAMAAYGAELARAERDVESALGQDDAALLEHVLSKIDKHVQRLQILRDNQVPEQARDAIQRAIDNAEKAKGRVGTGASKGKGKPDGVPGKGRENAPGQNK